MHDGRVAVITGAGRGIGRATARRLAAEGAAVVLSSRTKVELDAVVAEIAAAGGNATAVVADATKRASAKMPVRHAFDTFGRLDILVNNVGGVPSHHGLYDDSDANDDSFEATLLLNVTSAWWTTTAALPIMRENGFGRVINIGSTESLHANAGCPAAYIVGKHGIAGLTKQLAQDVGDPGITVNCICPGWTRTSMVDFAAIGQMMGKSAIDAEAYAAGQCSQNLVLEPEDIADTAAFLASEKAARITGQVISVDGGYRL